MKTRLHDPNSLRFAGVAVIAGGFILGSFLGRWLEGQVCPHEPSYARIGMLTGALLVIALDLILRATHAEAAERLGARRFLDAESGARLFRLVPAWMVGVALSIYAAQEGLRHGFC
jgi:hypothetical protein